MEERSVTLVNVELWTTVERRNEDGKFVNKE